MSLAQGVGGDAIEVRRIRADEWEALRALRLTALRAEPLAFGSTHGREEMMADDAWREWSRDGAASATGALFVAESGGALVGLAGTWPLGDVRDPAYGLFAMWTAPDLRRRGVGQRLVEAAVEFAAAAGAPEIRLQVTQEAAKRLYERCGFRDDGRREPLPHAPEVVEIGMSRSLA